MANLKLINGSTEQTFSNVETIKCPTDDGGTQIFETQKERQAKTVSLLLSNGNQEVTADEGKVLSSVTIEKPSTLKPENIAEGIDIGGVIGSLVASGGDVKVASGTMSGGTGAQTVTHGLGVVPDLIVVGNVNSDTSYPYILNLWGMSKALGTLYGYASSYKIHGAIKSSSSGLSLVCNGSDITTTSSVHLCNANDTTFTVGVSGLRIIDGTRWLAIGGLTE